MKKAIIILASIVTILLLTAIFIPIIFKDDIQRLVRKTIDESIDAKVYYNPSDFSLSLFKSFPNPTASIEGFGIVGNGVFDKDTLISVKDFSISINLFSLFGDQYSINSIDLVEPKINIKVLNDGRANYEIVVASEEDTVTSIEEDASDFNLSIDNWNVSNGRISYLDETMDFHMILDGFNHNGSGDITLDVYDLDTYTTIDRAVVAYEGIDYISGQRLQADLTLNINMPEFKFTFGENELRVNDFPVSFSGFVAMSTDDINMDISFASENSSIKQLYSLVPGAFTEGYEDIKAEGDVSFSGFAKGIYNEKSMPAYEVNLQATNGEIAYPELPTPISNINLDMLVACKDGVIENTLIDIRKFHLDMGKNPIDGSMIIRNLRDYSMKADVNASLDLADLGTMFPIEGLDMKGLFKMNLKADGVYDSVKQIIPAIAATASLQNGYIKSSEFPKALENVSFAAAATCPSGNMKDMIIKVDNAKVAMEGDELTANLMLKDMVDYQWDLNVKGGMDLKVISAVYPIEGMEYSGHVSADIKTKGRYSDVEAERYDRFPTSGNMELSDFSFVSMDLPQGMKISNASVQVDPRQMGVKSMKGTIGRSDIALHGNVTNYIDFIFKENAPLKGKMVLNSNLLDVNEWMTDEPATEEIQATDSVEMEVVAIPENIDFEFQSAIKTIYYDNLKLENAKGLLTVKEGILDMRDLSFNLLGGDIVMNGKYDSRQKDNPGFDFNLDIRSLSIPDAFTSFSTVQTFAPIAKEMNGEFSSKFKINGSLKPDFTPDYSTLNGKGVIEIAEAYVKESALVSGIAGLMKTDVKSSQLSLKDVVLKTSLENGRAYISPIDVKLADQVANVSGSIGADGSLDYKVSTEVDAGALGQQVNQLLAGLKGQNADSVNSKVKLNFKVGGTYDSPKISLAGTTNADGTTTTITEKVKQDVNVEVDKAKEAAKEQVEEQVNELAKQGEKKLDQQVDSLTKKVADGIAEKLGGDKDSTATELKKTFENLFKKKK